MISLLTLLTLLSFLASPFDNLSTTNIAKTWFLFVSWYDYYDFFFSLTVTDLNLLHEIYFTNNSFEFFLINFVLLYGIISSILLSFFVKRIFNFLNYSQLMDTRFIHKTQASYFIRNQDYLKQQSTSAGTRV